MGALKITGQSAEPTVTASDAGTIYYDSDTNKLRHYNGTAWADVSPAAAALTSADLPAGTIVQTVVSAASSVSTTTYSSTFAAKPTPLVTITPSSTSNKIFIVGTTRVDNTSDMGLLDLHRSIADGASTNNLSGESSGMMYMYANGSRIIVPMTIAWVDSPGVEDVAVTYKFSIKNSNNSTGVIFGYDTSGSMLTAMEIKA
mgnify:CR=1 FL=1